MRNAAKIHQLVWLLIVSRNSCGKPLCQDLVFSPRVNIVFHQAGCMSQPMNVDIFGDSTKVTVEENSAKHSLNKQDQGSQVATQVAKYQKKIPKYPSNKIL